MLYGPNTSGFGWNNDKKCVVAEPHVWEEYMKSHKGAVMFKNKSLPYFEEFLIIFGKDRATGRNAQTAADVVEELDKEVAEKRVRINEELLKLPTIFMFERHKAILQIARDHGTTDVFFTIADDEKEE
ncbi:hypothetical protein F0562_003248 [Nyssa sinensis]|uniref:Myb/SANT-like domain-containing protein n=1 Tax=Nyssa sinensis TaxID=561372 RepID=A0A5J5BVJ1_9ASTE|nr:hypothetical protein F0562_003248 [Nyssa sinensis]